MTGVKIALMGIAATSLAQIPMTDANWYQLYKDGGIAVLAIIAVVYLYRDSKKRQEKFETLLERTCVVMQAVTDAISKCKKE